jgi:uncharacterized protein involved in type VI secretion and phage assembly
MSLVKSMFYGKYRGHVVENTDPMMIGRIRAKVPSVFGDSSSGWALPCVPYAGNKVGFFFIPPIGANVWIEFEGGNTDLPIWTGCFWGPNEIPDEANSPGVKVIKTDFAALTFKDQSGAKEFVIETNRGMRVVLDESGLELRSDMGTIKINGRKVSINDGALEII